MTSRHMRARASNAHESLRVLVLDESTLFDEAQVLSSVEHLAAVFGCSVDDLAPYNAIITRARLVSEHSFMKHLKALADKDDIDAIKLWAQFIKSADKSVPLSPEDVMDAVKAQEILRREHI